MRETRHAYQVQGLGHYLAVLGAGEAQPAEASRTSHHHHVRHRDREVPVDNLALWHIADGAASASCVGRPTGNLYAARAGAKRTEYRLDKGGLARAVRTYDTHH